MYMRMIAIVASFLLAALMFGGAWLKYQDPSAPFTITQAFGGGVALLAFAGFQLWARNKEKSKTTL